MKYQRKFHPFCQGQGWNIAELAFSQLADILSFAPQLVKHKTMAGVADSDKRTSLPT